MRRRTLVMNRTLALAAVLAAFTFIVHLVVGTGEIAAPLFASALPPEIRYLLYACWHLVSCALALSAAMFFRSGGTFELITNETMFLQLIIGFVLLIVASLFEQSILIYEENQLTI